MAQPPTAPRTPAPTPAPTAPHVLTSGNCGSQRSHTDPGVSETFPVYQANNREGYLFSDQGGHFDPGPYIALCSGHARNRIDMDGAGIKRLLALLQRAEECKTEDEYKTEDSDDMPDLVDSDDSDSDEMPDLVDSDDSDSDDMPDLVDSDDSDSDEMPNLVDSDDSDSDDMPALVSDTGSDDSESDDMPDIVSEICG
jgi:hypothetical protein